MTELFPVSSLGHSVILPGLFDWTNVVAAQSAKESLFLAFLVGLHVATALALAFLYRDQWVRIVLGLLRSLCGAATSRRQMSVWAGSWSLPRSWLASSDSCSSTRCESFSRRQSRPRAFLSSVAESSWRARASADEPRFAP